MKNWAGNQHFSPKTFYEPTSIDQLIELVKNANKLRVIGTRHSFNEIADSPQGAMVSLKHLDRIVHLNLDDSNPTVTFEAGMTYGKLAAYLHSQGYALKNMASLPHISVAGAIATATHGSGDQNGCLATEVVALDLATPDGLRKLSRETIGEKFNGAVVGMGGIGVVAHVTLQVVPGFDLQQRVFQDANWEEMRDDFDSIMGLSYSVSLFTNWRNRRINQIWFKDYVGTLELPEVFANIMPVEQDVHPLESCSPDACTKQVGIPGPWHQRLPHFRLEFNPSHGDELQSEYILPRRHATQAIDQLFELGGLISPWLLVSEIRSIAADNLWMSPFYQQPGVGIHFTWKKSWQEVQKLLPIIESKLAPFHARPHWGKLFSIEPERIKTLYPRLNDFRLLLSEYDPTGKFRNPFIETFIF